MAAAMLVLTCVATTQRATAGSLWGSLINLTADPAEFLPDLYVVNHTGRIVRLRVWTNHGEYSRTVLVEQGTSAAAMWSNASRFAVEAAVWNPNKRKYVVKDYGKYGGWAEVEFYRHGRGDFRLRRGFFIGH